MLSTFHKINVLVFLFCGVLLILLIGSPVKIRFNATQTERGKCLTSGEKGEFNLDRCCKHYKAINYQNGFQCIKRSGRRENLDTFENKIFIKQTFQEDEEAIELNIAHNFNSKKVKSYIIERKAFFKYFLNRYQELKESNLISSNKILDKILRKRKRFKHHIPKYLQISDWSSWEITAVMNFRKREVGFSVFDALGSYPLSATMPKTYAINNFGNLRYQDKTFKFNKRSNIISEAADAYRYKVSGYDNANKLVKVYLSPVIKNINYALLDEKPAPQEATLKDPSLEDNKPEKNTRPNNCGNGICEEVVCMGLNCPLPETIESCPEDCSEQEPTPETKEEVIEPINNCGNGICDNIVCVSPPCPTRETADSCPEDCSPKKPDNCGNGVCEEVVCMGLNCPKPETVENCPEDCSKR